MLPTSGLPCERAHATARRLKSSARVVHGIDFDGVEELCVALDASSERSRNRIEGMRRDHEARCLLFERRDIVEAAHGGDAGRKVDEEHMPETKRALDASHQHHAARPRVLGVRRRVEVAVVERDRQPSVTERCSAVDQVAGRMVDAILPGLR